MRYGLGALFGVLAPLSGACAHPHADLYSAMVYVTGQYEETRLEGFTRALEEVLAKASGDGRLIDDPRVKDIAADATATVGSFAYRDRMEGIPIHDEQGTRQRPYELTVTFPPETIDALLASLGSTPWLDRPDVFVLAKITTGDVTYALTSDGSRGRDLREALAAESRRTGMTAFLPSDASSEIPDGAVALTGAITWNDANLGWIADWRFSDERGDHAWQISGVSFDAAFRSGLRGVAQVLSGNGEP